MIIIPTLTSLPNPRLISTATLLRGYGTLTQSLNNLIYLDIDDQFIHSLFPLLMEPSIQKPNYFGNDLAGAHISVIYPEEGIVFNPADLRVHYQFQVKSLAKTNIHSKTYFVLLVHAPGLIQLRKKYKLAEQLNFKNHIIDLHITIGVRQL